MEGEACGNPVKELGGTTAWTGVLEGDPDCDAERLVFSFTVNRPFFTGFAGFAVPVGVLLAISLPGPNEPELIIAFKVAVDTLIEFLDASVELALRLARGTVWGKLFVGFSGGGEVVGVDVDVVNLLFFPTALGFGGAEKELFNDSPPSSICNPVL